MWRTVPTVSGPGHPVPRSPVAEGSANETTMAEPARPSSASGPLPAPDLVGMTPQDARRYARFAEVELHVEERPTDSGLRGRVFRQEPIPGTELKPGDVVTAFVGTRPLVPVPDVSGLDEQESLSVLRAAGLTPSRRVVRRSRSVAVGHVIRTRPRAGSEVSVGTRVAYVVAVAPRPKRSESRRDARRGRDRGLPDGAFLSMPIGE
jgi:hypothetical protein